MEFPTYVFFGLQLSEVNLFVTDLIIASTAFVCFVNIRKKTANHIALSNFANFFILMMMATLISGFGHLFTFYTGIYLKLIGWLFTLLANYFMVVASLQFEPFKNKFKQYKYLIVSKLVLFIIILLTTKAFIVITIDTIISIGIIVLPIHFFQWIKTANNGFLWICAGIVFTMLTGLVSAFNLSISEIWFNAKDINHIIISGGLILMYKGITKL